MHSNPSNPFRIVWICVQMLWIPFKWLEFALKRLKPIRMVLICIQIFRILFEWFKFAFEWFEFLSNGSNLHWNASNPFLKVQICIRMLRIPFDCSNLHSNASNPFDGSNLHSNASNPFQTVRICVWMLWNPFEWF